MFYKISYFREKFNNWKQTDEGILYNVFLEYKIFCLASGIDPYIDIFLNFKKYLEHVGDFKNLMTNRDVILKNNDLKLLAKKLINDKTSIFWIYQKYEFMKY